MRIVTLCLVLTLLAGGAVSTTPAAGRSDASAVRQTLDEAQELRTSIEERLEGRSAEFRREIDKLIRPAATRIEKAERRLGDGDIEPARRDADAAARLLRKADERLDGRNG